MTLRIIFGQIPPQLYLGFEVMMPGKLLWAIMLKKFALSLKQINGHMYRVLLIMLICLPVVVLLFGFLNQTGGVDPIGSRTPGTDGQHWKLRQLKV
ncbi:hypothetical protein TNCT_660581 [Trichonephila clavata]|uniref:Uncharacterized protein n=1 Tax=Trichonephila clavata TaxID=2740835 RepID=A0A8X6GYQ1_TRICU|nr:hypothetical protein TNCT_660581 [Trichonephila clavata]